MIEGNFGARGVVSKAGDASAVKQLRQWVVLFGSGELGLRWRRVE
jgi:hypothetical protein